MCFCVEGSVRERFHNEILNLRHKGLIEFARLKLWCLKEFHWREWEVYREREKQVQKPCVGKLTGRYHIREIENWELSYTLNKNWLFFFFICQVFGWEGVFYGWSINKERRKNMLELNHLSLVNLLFPNNYSFIS